jgi:hypothetical protein
MSKSARARVQKERRSAEVAGSWSTEIKAGPSARFWIDCCAKGGATNFAASLRMTD